MDKIIEVKVIKEFGNLEIGDVLKYDEDTGLYKMNKIRELYTLNGIKSSEVKITVFSRVIESGLGEYFVETDEKLAKKRIEDKLKDDIKQTEDLLQTKQYQVDELLDKISDLNKQLKQL